MKSLDALISYLLEEVALCGEQGAGPSEVFEYITAFYAKSSRLEKEEIAQEGVDKINDTVLIDRPFQVQVWKWLVNHPECRVGPHRRKGKGSVSEAEAPSHALPNDATAARPALPEQNGLRNVSEASGAHKDGNSKAPTIAEPSDGPAQSQSTGEQAGPPPSSPLAKRDTSGQRVDRSQAADGTLRVYANEERMWHALTGHGVDYSKIPLLHFTCLSIIAAAGPQGILQSEVVTRSDQDKRSVPRRTQDLFEKGYITKIPILHGSARTSLCKLKRFETTPGAPKLETDSDRDEPDRDRDSQEIFHQCFRNGGANLFALLRNIFDLLNHFKIMTLEDLRRKLVSVRFFAGLTSQLTRAPSVIQGVIGHRWERRVLASTLRKLEAVGCAKQVRARAQTLGDGSTYFRCLKLIREPGENESQYLCGVSHLNLRSVNIDHNLVSDSESEVEEDDQAHQDLSLAGLANGAEPASLQELRRPIPQWTGGGCLGNLLYDLIQRTGPAGLTTMDVKDQLFGRFIARPIENQLTRIVDHWQISQPAHLRHLAIIRDTAMGKKSTHYIHYTYDHFKTLVEKGEASWEAVSVPEGNSQNRHQPTFARGGNLDLDEYGFSIIPKSLFHGRQNDATVSQCAHTVQMAAVSVNRNDPVVEELHDGTYEIHHAMAPQRRFALKPATVKPSLKKSTTPRPRGRPRKMPRIDAPETSTLTPPAKHSSSWRAAIRYQKKRIEQEIARRIGDQEDPNRVREDIFAMVSAKYLGAGEDVPASIKELRVQDMTLSGSPATAICLPLKTPSGKEQMGKDSRTDSQAAFLPEYLPSVAAHTQPIVIHLGSRSCRLAPGSKPASTRLLKKSTSGGDTGKAEKVSKSNESTGMTYEEQSRMIKRENCGIFVGVDALRARLPGQRGRSRKCRLAIFKSARLSEFAWFSDSPVAFRNEKSTSVCDEVRDGSHVPNPCFPVSAKAAQQQTTPSTVEASGLLPAKNNHTDPNIPGQIAPCSDHHAWLKNGLAEGLISDHVHTSNNAVSADSNATLHDENDTFASFEAGCGCQAASEKNHSAPLGSSHHISPFTPINLRRLVDSKCLAASESAPHINHGEALSSKDVLETRASNVVKTNVQTRLLSPSQSSEMGAKSGSPLSENGRRISVRENQDITDHEVEIEPTPSSEAPFILHASSPVADSTVTDADGGSMAAKARLAKPVTITGGSVSMLRKKIVMDIMQMCGGIYSGHKELVDPFFAAWAKQNKPGKPDSKTVYTAFRALVQADRLRELKFSFQTPEGLVVTKSMITVPTISPTDPRVTEMQQHIKAYYPAPYIPEGVEILDQARSLPAYPRTTADLEIDNELEVRLQHKPLYVTRLERRITAAETTRKERQERIEATRAKREKRIERARLLKSSKLVGMPQGVERLASIRRPVVRYKNDPMTGSTVEMPHIGLADVDLDFTYISSGDDAREHERAGNIGEFSLPKGKRKYDLTDAYEISDNAHDSPAGNKKRRLTEYLPTTTRRSERPAHPLRQISAMMNPEQKFHAATGTFSVSFSGLQTSEANFERPRDKATFNDGAATNFGMEVDELLNSELAMGDFLNPVYPEWSFIHYHLSHPHRTPAETEYVIEPDFKVELEGRQDRRSRKPSNGSPVQKINTFGTALNTGVTSEHAQPGKKTHKRKRIDPTLKIRRLTALGDANALADFSAFEGATHLYPNGTRPAKVRRVRGPQKQVPMTRDEEERLLAAVIAIRTITGGVEKNPDWVLIARLFQPEYSQMYIQKKWAQVQQRYRLQLDQIQANFQIQFAKAYEDNTMPTIDFDHLEDYDWESLVEWTLVNIDTSWDSLQHLPSKRQELDFLFDITASKDTDISDFFEVDSSFTLERREADFNKFPYVCSIKSQRQQSSNTPAKEVAIARTWVRANVITPAASYKPDLARTKLSTLSESSVDTALQELLSARLLSQANKGRLVPGRNYDISIHFVNRLRKKLDVAQLRRAAAFKRRLDEKFGKETSVIVPYESPNGDMMAIVNLLARGRITVSAKNPPMEKFGFTDGGYRTRQMDKSRMNFDVEIQRAPTYLAGNPLAPMPIPPCQHLDDPMARIPLWYDIHGQFVPIMWDMLLAATMSMLAIRSCASAAEIEQSVRPSAELWEVELLLEWMVLAGAATKTAQGGYTVTEWWWLCFDNNDLDQRSGEDVLQPKD